MGLRYPISNSSVIDSRIEEFYMFFPPNCRLESKTSVTQSIQNGKNNFSFILDYNSEMKNYFYSGLCHLTGIGQNIVWNNDSVICSRSLEINAAKTQKLIILIPKTKQIDSTSNDFEVVGPVAILVLYTGENDYDTISAKRFCLNKSVLDLNNWPKIKSFITSGFLYCDSINGRDNWPGTIQYPMNSIVNALRLHNRIQVKANSVFYENLTYKPNNGYAVYNRCIIFPYGDGSNPVINGLKSIKSGMRPWIRGTFSSDGKFITSANSGNIWRIHLSDMSLFSGINVGSNSPLNNIGTIINIDTNSPCGARRVPNSSDLKSNFDYWQNYYNNSAYGDGCDYLYLYLDKDPNDMHLGFSSGAHGFEGVGSITNIDFKNWGRHGAQIQSGSNISGCNFDIIGGSLQEGYENWACYGNGIEIYILINAQGIQGTDPIVSNINVRDCKVSRCFDAGITLQGSNKNYDITKILAKDILFDNIEVVNCRYGIEMFVRVPNSTVNGHKATLSNCEFSNCKIRAARYEAPIFRRSSADGKEDDSSYWGMRVPDRYQTGLKISNCEIDCPNIIRGLLNFQGTVSPAFITGIASVTKGSVLLLYGYSSSESISISRTHVGNISAQTKEFKNLCPTMQITFIYTGYP